MSFITNTFYGGLTAGILIGLTFDMIKNYILRTKWTSQNEKSVCESQQPKSLINQKGEFKMALLVRHDLKMGKGKVAAQVRQFELNSTLELKYYVIIN